MAQSPEEIKQKVAAFNRVYHQKHRDKNNAKHREWMKRNADHVKAYTASYKKEHREEILEKKRVWARAAKKKNKGRWKLSPKNIEGVKRRRAAYKRGACGKAASANHHAKRRVKMAGIEKTLTAREAKDILSQTQCFWCQKPFSQELRPQLDHIVAIAQGGPHTKDNCVAACALCNNTKNDSELWKWLIKLPEMWLRDDLASSKNLDTAQIESLHERLPFLKLLAGMMLSCSAHSHILCSAAYKAPAGGESCSPL